MICLRAPKRRLLSMGSIAGEPGKSLAYQGSAAALESDDEARASTATCSTSSVGAELRSRHRVEWAIAAGNGATAEAALPSSARRGADPDFDDDDLQRAMKAQQFGRAFQPKEPVETISVTAASDSGAAVDPLSPGPRLLAGSGGEGGRPCFARSAGLVAAIQHPMAGDGGAPDMDQAGRQRKTRLPLARCYGPIGKGAIRLARPADVGRGEGLRKA